MSRQPVLASAFVPYGHAQSHYEGVVASGLTYRAPPLPMRPPPELTSGYNTQQQHTGHHHHGRTSTVSMSGPAQPYMPSDEELAHLQKLSSEYEPEATVRRDSP